MVETNDAAERLEFPVSKMVIAGSEQKQAEYYRRLLGLAQEKDFEFVVSFVHRDYDALWEKIKGFSPELFIAWKDCGLVDEEGREREAFGVWKKYLGIKLVGR